jgi:SAM-dependent methyltransferase
VNLPTKSEFEIYKRLEKEYVSLDRKQIRRTKNIRLIPLVENRFGGKLSYAEWAHVIGIFQTLIYLNTREKQGNTILDIGCGTGLLAIASEPFVSRGGRYLGLDVKREVIEFCRSHYPSPAFEFIHSAGSNAVYSPNQTGQKAWPLEDSSVDLITALSVWSHLNEDDAQFYLQEVKRVLRPNSRAIITGFRLDQLYYDHVDERSDEQGLFNFSRQNQWIFDQPTYGSVSWYHPKWADIPEKAIGFTDKGLEKLVETSGLKLVDYHPGCWKEIPGIFFQDILVFER